MHRFGLHSSCRRRIRFGSGAPGLSFMTEVINLRQARKKKVRAAASAAAAGNRLRHGQTKAERDNEEARRAKAVRFLDAHKREKGE